MSRLTVPLSLLVLAACARALPAPDPSTAPPPPPSTTEAVATPAPAVYPAATTSATSDPPALELLDIAAKCKEACERNGAKCDVIDVPGCTAQCTENLGPAQPMCPGRMRAFFECVERDELRCKEGSKIRTVGCEEEGWAMATCLLNSRKPPEERCAAECSYSGHCLLEEGECVGGSEEDCAKSTECKERLEGQICKLVDKKCKVMNPPASD